MQIARGETLMKKSLLLLLLCTCGKTPEASPARVAFSMPLTSSQCTTIVGKDIIKARITIESVATPCDLDVTLSPQGVLLTQGLCPRVPVSDVPDTKLGLAIQWYVLSPTLRKEITLAEVTAEAEFSTKTVSQATLTLDFANNKPPLVVQTKAKSMETAAKRDRFNCDRSGNFGPGDTPCDSNKPVVQTPSGDKDNCSNLEELCVGTLFNATDDLTCSAI